MASDNPHGAFIGSVQPLPHSSIEPITQRGASIEIGQQLNGYWRGSLTVRIPGLPEQHFEGVLFHDAGEALDWSRQTIQATVLDAR